MDNETMVDPQEERIEALEADLKDEADAAVAVREERDRHWYELVRTRKERDAALASVDGLKDAVLAAKCRAACAEGKAEGLEMALKLAQGVKL